MTRWLALGIFVLALALAAGSIASGAKIELPEQTATLKAGPGADLANGQCLICHSAEYITTQPSDKPLAFWKAEVEKMKKVYGAPIPDDQVLALAAYLTRSYGTEGP